ncbi:MAG: hypothetical protein GY807_10975 [Gammaproteobacteria bacterium]|nr:hypothetical protein [Gammaproteobacteria bacterium]
MRYLHKLLKLFAPIFLATSLAILLTGLSWITLDDFTAKSRAKPIFSKMDVAEPPIFSTSVLRKGNISLTVTAANPVANAFINAIPSSDGTEIHTLANGIISTGNPVYFNVDPGVGGGGTRGAHAMTLSGTTYLATAIGFAAGQDGSGDMSISTTVGSQIMDTGPLKFVRALVEITKDKTISVDYFTWRMPNTYTFSISRAYVLAMSTNALPGALPTGYSQASSPYNVTASGAVTQSDKIMTLDLAYQQPLPNNSDPHTLAVLGWDAFNEKWDVLGGELFVNSNLVNLITQRFRIYALVTTPTWRDSFQEYSLPDSLPGISDSENIEREVFGTNIILTTTPGTGTATSIPITPTNATNWGTLNFSATITPGTELAVDLLDAGDNVVMANVSAGTDLSGLSLSTYPTLKLRATLTSTTAESPKLHEWQLSWEPKVEKIYLPLILKNQS